MSKLSKKNEEEVKNSLNLIAKSSVFVFFAVALSKIFTYVYRILIARYLGAEIYGLFSLAFMVFGWFIAVSSFGLFEGLLRFIPIYREKKQKDKIKHLFSITLIILTFSSLASAILLFFLSNTIATQIFHDPNLTIFLKAFSLALPLSVLSTIFLSIIRAYEKIKPYSFILNILQNGIRVISIVFFIFIGIKTNAVIFSFILGILATLLASFLYAKFKLPEIFGVYKIQKEDKKFLTRDLVNYSWPLMFFAIVNNLFNWIDSFSIGIFLDTTQVGFYNAAVPISLILGMAPELFMQIFFPMITREYTENRMKVVKELSKQVTKWIFIVNVPLFLLIVIFPGAFLNILFGPEFLVASSSLRFLAIGSLIFSISSVSENLLRSIGKSKLILTNVVLASVLNLILNFILVPKYGIEGASAATSISYFFFGLAIMVESKINLKFFALRRKMAGTLIAALISAGIIYVARDFVVINLVTLLFLVLIYFIIYFVLIFLFKSLDRNDIAVVKNLIFKKV